MKNNKLWEIFKTYVINSFKLKTYNIKKASLFIILALYIIASIMFSVGTVFTKLFDTLHSFSMDSYFIAFLYSLASLFSFVFTIFSAKSGLFENKDNDLLLSLPVNKKIILLSRLLYLTIFNFLIGLVFIIPGLYIYLTNVNVSFIFYILIIIMTIFMPIIPTILASLFGYLVALLVSKVERKNIFELIYYFLFIGLYMYIMTNSNKLLLNLAANQELLNTILKTVFLPIHLITTAINTNNILYILYFILFNLICLYLFVTILNKTYFKIIIKLNSFHTKSNYKMKKLVTRSKIKSLYHKELSRYLSCAVYVFNTIFGVLLILGISIASLFYSFDTIMSFINMDFSTTPSMLIFCLLLFSIAMTNTTSASISIERNNFWILKVLPIKVKDIFNAKLFVNEIIIIPTVLISLVLFKMSGYINYQELILLFIFASLFGLFVSNFGLISNLLFPRFDAVSDIAVVKQSVSVMFGLLIPLFLSMIVISIVPVLTSNIVTILYIAIAISLFLTIVSKVILNTWGIKKFLKLS